MPWLKPLGFSDAAKWILSIHMTCPGRRDPCGCFRCPQMVSETHGDPRILSTGTQPKRTLPIAIANSTGQKGITMGMRGTKAHRRIGFVFNQFAAYIILAICAPTTDQAHNWPANPNTHVSWAFFEIQSENNMDFFGLYRRRITG